jgi:hypothetical protein
MVQFFQKKKKKFVVVREGILFSVGCNKVFGMGGGKGMGSLK